MSTGTGPKLETAPHQSHPPDHLPHLGTTRNGGVQELLIINTIRAPKILSCLAATLTTELNCSCLLTTITSLPEQHLRNLFDPKFYQVRMQVPLLRLQCGVNSYDWGKKGASSAAAKFAAATPAPGFSIQEDKPYAEVLQLPSSVV